MKKRNILVLDSCNAKTLTSGCMRNENGSRIVCEKVSSEFYYKHYRDLGPDDKVTIELMAAQAGRRFGADCVVISSTEQTTRLWSRLTFYAFSDTEEREGAKIKAKNIERKIQKDLRDVKIMRKLSMTSFAIGFICHPVSTLIYPHVDKDNLADILIYLQMHMALPVCSFLFGGMLLNYLKNSRIRSRLQLATTPFAPNSRENILMKNGIDFR